MAFLDIGNANREDRRDDKAGDTDKSKKKQAIEDIYQKKSQLEHILLRPDSYIGSVESTSSLMYVWDSERSAVIQREISYVPGLYKIFDEILVNAADNKIRDPSMNSIKVTINPERNLIKVWNNGRGIPVEMHKEEKVFVPAMIFGTLLTSSNYDDTEKKVVGGRNGYGAKLCNIFSQEFTVETASSESNKSFKQTWRDNMTSTGHAIVKESKSDFTSVTFIPDLEKFGMTSLNEDIVSLLSRRAYDVAASSKGVKVQLNGVTLPMHSFKDYVTLYLKGAKENEDAELPKIAHEVVNDRWEVAITASDSGFQQASFVNSIATPKGGTHVLHVLDQIIPKLLEQAKKKLGKGSVNITPAHIKNHIWIFVNCLIENPTFDSQTKECMTLKTKSFGSDCKLSEKFIIAASKCGILERILDWAHYKSQVELSKKCHSSKRSKLKGIAKLDDANEAGTKNSRNCTLILTEGDSAKGLAVAGLGVIGRDRYGVFPLRGKLLNVREANHKSIFANEELTNLVKIFGLQYHKKYVTDADMSSLRYGKMMMMTDQDQDGSHIKGLLINFIHYNWPELIRTDFMMQFITPIVKATKGNEVYSFFSLPEYEYWKTQRENWKSYKIKYYKGLGTSTAKEAKEYFSEMDHHQIAFDYTGNVCDDSIEMAFSKKRVDDRKQWILDFTSKQKQLREAGINESFLYDGVNDSISYEQFVNKELILFSNADNERAIPNVMDGLKPSQRKVLYTCFKRNDKRDVKVAQLAGSISELSAYHHGEVSLMSTIINMAQNYVGSNNINLLQPIGMFGTRLHGGKDAASPRYIFTMLSPLARLIFPQVDDSLLNFLFDDNLMVEPDWYCPILPMVLVNGCEGIGTGFSTSVPTYNPRDIVDNLKLLINNSEPKRMVPYYKNFIGTIIQVEPNKYICYGVVSKLSSTQIEISELPIGKWTQVYKETLLEPMLHGAEKIACFIQDYKEYHTDTTVKFIITLTEKNMQESEKVGFHKKFKLETSITTGNMVLFSSGLELKLYQNELAILTEFFTVRLNYYELRKKWLMEKYTAESKKLSNQARFILEKLEGKMPIENKKKIAIIALLKSKGYDSDPVKKWQKLTSRPVIRNSNDNDENDENNEDDNVNDDMNNTADQDSDFNYLLSMPFWNLSTEKKDEMLQTRDKKLKDLENLSERTIHSLWLEDLDSFLIELDKLETKEKEEDLFAGTSSSSSKSRGKKGAAKKQPAKKTAKFDLYTENSSLSNAFKELIDPIVPAYSDLNIKERKLVRSPSKASLKSKISKMDMDDELHNDNDLKNDKDSDQNESGSDIALIENKNKKANIDKEEAKLSSDDDEDFSFKETKSLSERMLERPSRQTKLSTKVYQVESDSDQKSADTDYVIPEKSPKKSPKKIESKSVTNQKGANQKKEKSMEIEDKKKKNPIKSTKQPLNTKTKAKPSTQLKKKQTLSKTIANTNSKITEHYSFHSSNDNSDIDEVISKSTRPQRENILSKNAYVVNNSSSSEEKSDNESVDSYNPEEKHSQVIADDDGADDDLIVLPKVSSSNVLNSTISDNDSKKAEVGAATNVELGKRAKAPAKRPPVKSYRIKDDSEESPSIDLSSEESDFEPSPKKLKKVVKRKN